MRLLIVINPFVAQAHNVQVKRILNLLSNACKHIQAVWTVKGSELCEIAPLLSGRHFDRVVVVGGDGTINEVANLLVGRSTPLAVIPLGTGNTFATNFGIPIGVEEACQIALNGDVISIDVGELNGRSFVCVAGIGFDAHVLHQLQPVFKRRFGKWAYAAASIGHLMRYRHSEMCVKMDEDKLNRVRAWLIVVSNVPTYALNFKFTPHAIPDDGLLDVCVFLARSKFDRLMQAALSLFGYHVRLSSTIHSRTKEIELQSEPPVLAHVDGEPICMTPVKINILPRALNVVVPQRFRMA